MADTPLIASIRRRGLMLVLSSPSGAGKSTIARKLLEALNVMLRAYMYLYGCASRLCALPEPVPRLVPRCLCRSGQRMRQATHISTSCTRKYTRVPTPVPCCSVVPYRTYTPLPPPTPPRSPPGACVVAYAACDKKIQNQDFSFDPPRTPLSYTPLSFAAGGRGGVKSQMQCVSKLLTRRSSPLADGRRECRGRW